MPADLVVDATGRGSRTPAWLAELGYPPPPEEQADLGVTYVTRQFRVGPSDPTLSAYVVTLCPPERRSGILQRVEGDRWILTLAGHDGESAPTDHILLTRQWLDVDGHHEPTPSFQAVATADTALWLSDPAPALSIMFMPDSDFWTPFFAFIDHAHAEDGDLEFGGRRYAMYLHDWRVTPRDAWLELMEPRERGLYEGAVELARRHVRTAPVVALSRAEFGAHVRDALRSACRPAGLARSPLLRSPLVAPPAGGDATATDLRAVLERGVAALAADPATARYARALEVTHLLRATTQEAAAARLSLPFSTYRRHLRAGTEALTDVLWESEIHGESHAEI